MRYTTGAALALAGRIGALVLGGVVAVLLARWLGPAARGEYALITLVPTVVVAVGGLGLGPAELHLVSRDPGRFGSALGNLLVYTAVASAAAGLCVVLLAPALASAVPVLGDGAYVAVIIASLPQLLFYAAAHQLLQAMRAFAWSSVLLVIGYVLFLVALVVALGVLQLGLPGALAAWLASHFVLTLLALVALCRTGPLHRPDLRLLRAELAYGLPSWLAGLALVIATRAPLFVAGVLLASADVGMLSVAITIGELLWYGAESAAVALTPLVARASGAGTAIPTAFVTRTVLLATAVGAAIVAAVAEPLLRVLFGAEFAPASGALRWLLPGIVALSAAKVVASDLLGRGRPALALLGYGAAAVGSAAAAPILIPLSGIAGASLAATLAYAIGAAVLLIVFARVSGEGIADLVIPRGRDARSLLELTYGLIRRGVSGDVAPPPSAG